MLTVTHLFRDVAVFIDVVQVERPVQFFLDRPSQEDGEAHDEILQPKTSERTFVWRSPRLHQSKSSLAKSLADS